MDKNEIKFLNDNGFNVVLDDIGFLESIIDISTGEKLQNVIDGAYCSADKSVKIVHNMAGTFIERDGLLLQQHGDYEISIKDVKTNEAITLKYSRGSLRNIYNLASIELIMENNNTKEDGLDINQGVFGADAISGSVIDKNLKITPLEDGNAEMYIKAIIDCIKETNYIVSNPKINAKLGLVLSFAQLNVNKLINAKYQHPDVIIHQIEKKKAELSQKKTELSQKLEAIDNEMERCDIVISQIKATGKKM